MLIERRQNPLLTGNNGDNDFLYNFHILHARIEKLLKIPLIPLLPLRSRFWELLAIKNQILGVILARRII